MRGEATSRPRPALGVQALLIALVGVFLQCSVASAVPAENSFVLRESCRDYPLGEQVDAGSLIHYAMQLQYGGDTDVDALLYVDKVDAGDLIGPSDLNNRDRFGFEFGTSVIPFQGTTVIVQGREYYVTVSSFTVPCDAPAVAALRVTVPLTAREGSAVGLTPDLVSIGTSGDPSVFQPLQASPGCTADPRPLARNVRLIAVLRLEGAPVLAAGSQRQLWMKVTNAGSKDLTTAWSFSPQPTFMDDISSVGTPPTFSGASLAVGNSSAEKSWTIDIAHTVSRQPDLDLRDLFLPELEGWSLTYAPIYPSGGFDTDPDAGDFPWTQAPVDITAPLLTGRIWTEPPGDLPQGNRLTVRAEIRNAVPGDQTGSYRLVFPTGETTVTNLKRLDSGTAWYGNVSDTVKVSGLDSLAFDFLVQAGDSVRLAGTIRLESDFPLTLQDDVEDLMILPTAIEVVGAATQAEATAGDTLSVRYSLHNHDRVEIQPAFLMLTPALQPPDDTLPVSLSEVRFYPVAGAPQFLSALSPGFGGPLQFGGAAPAVAAGTTSGLVAILRTPRALPDGTEVTPGDLQVRWRPQQPDSGSLTHTFTRGCTIRNVHFHVVSASVKQDGVVQTSSLEACKTASLEVLLRNTSEVAADSVSAQVRAIHGSTVDTMLVSQNNGPIEANSGERTLTFDLFIDPQRFQNGVALSLGSLDVDAHSAGADPVVDGTVAWQALVKSIDLYFDVRRLTSILADTSATPGAPVDAGVPVSFGLFVENRGELSQAGLLRLTLLLPGVSPIPLTGNSVNPQGTWSSQTDGGGLTLIFEDQMTLAPGAELRYDGHVPAFSVPTAGRDEVRVVQRTVWGTMTTTGECGRKELMSSSDDPAPVPVNPCSVNSLVFELLPAEERDLSPGDTIHVVLRTAFSADVEPIPGTLTLSVRIPEDLPFRLVDAVPLRVLTGVATSAVLDWDERSAQLRSELLRNKSGSGAWEELWRLKLQAESVGLVGQHFAGPEIVDLSVVGWDVDGGAGDVPCGLDRPFGEIEAWPRLPDPWPRIFLQGSRGQLTKLFASPNPGRDEMKVCYDLMKGAVSVRLIVTDLAGTPVMIASDRDGMTMNAGINCLTWDLKGDRVPNGVYLARLDVDGSDASGNSMLETRRIKVGVLR